MYDLRPGLKLFPHDELIESKYDKEVNC